MRNKIGRLLLLVMPAFLAVVYTIIASRLVNVRFLSILPAVIFLFAAFFIHYKDYKGSKKYQFIYIVLFVLDLILIIYNSVYKNLPMTGVDWHNFDSYAQSALASSNNVFEIFGNSKDLFSALVAIIYKVFGINISIVYFYILPLSFVLAHYVFKTIKLIRDDDRIAMLMSTIILLMPVNLIFSLSVLREIPIQCIAMISLYCFLKYLRAKSDYNLIGAVVFALLAALMHTGMAAILIIYIYVFLQKKFFGNIRIVRLATVFFAILLILATSLPVFSSVVERFGIDGGMDGVANAVNVQNGHLLDANTAYIDKAPTDIAELIVGLPYRLVMFIISPLPWQIYGLDTMIAFLMDAVFRYYIVFKVIKIMFSLKKYSIENREIIETLFMSIVLFDLIFCLGTTNYGTAMRHRAKMLPFELVLLAIPTVENKQKEVKEKTIGE